MQVELSPDAEAVLKTVLSDGEDAAKLVELALVEYAESRDPENLPAEYLDVKTGESYRGAELRKKIAEAERAITDGDVLEFNSKADLKAFMEDVKTRGLIRSVNTN